MPDTNVSTVLEQDHFCSVFLVSHVTVLTNSQNRDDEVTSHAKYQVRTIQDFHSEMVRGDDENIRFEASWTRLSGFVMEFIAFLGCFWVMVALGEIFR